MAKNPLLELYEAGTSVWLDNMRRSYLTSGELQRMIDEDAVVGMTSNPTIFEKAIGGRKDYVESGRQAAETGVTGQEVFLRPRGWGHPDGPGRDTPLCYTNAPQDR